MALSHQTQSQGSRLVLRIDLFWGRRRGLEGQGRCLCLASQLQSIIARRAWYCEAVPIRMGRKDREELWKGSHGKMWFLKTCPH